MIAFLIGGELAVVSLAVGERRTSAIVTMGLIAATLLLVIGFLVFFALYQGYGITLRSMVLSLLVTDADRYELNWLRPNRSSVQGVAGSNPVSPTRKSRKLKGFRDFLGCEI